MIKKLTKVNIFFLIFLFFLDRSIFASIFDKNELVIERVRSSSFALAADSMLGRGNGQEGLKIAEKYIIDKLNQLSNSNKAIIQKVPIIEISPRIESEFQIINSIGKKDFILNKDYLIHNSGQMKFIPNETEVVFVGYGIFAPEFDFNDYYNINVSGKIVLILEGAPKNVFSDGEASKYSVLEYKQRTALSRGAAAIIIIPIDFQMSLDKWEHRVSSYLKPEYNLAFGNNNIPTIIVNPYLTQDLFDFQLPEADILSFIEHNKLILNTKIIFKPKYRDRSFTISNIIYEIKGKNKKLNDKCIILSAHYDHLGYSNPNDSDIDSIYNGFQDNALGCAFLLEIANYYSKNIPDRTILLIFTAGEEIGLLGSKYYLNNPYYPLYKTLANINIDGVAFIDEFTSIIGIGSEYSNLEVILNDVAKMNSMTVEKINQEIFELDAFSRSEQIAFAYSGIPSIMIIDGMNYKNIDKQQGIEIIYDYFERNYHTTIDDSNQDINWEASIQHLKIIIDFSKKLVNSDFIPEWHQKNRFYLQRLRTEIEKR